MRPSTEGVNRRHGARGESIKKSNSGNSIQENKWLGQSYNGRHRLENSPMITVAGWEDCHGERASVSEYRRVKFAKL
ncbi:hypothetical protein E2C01_064883 [Portunus trituberculatus]|uniref:Uncharacterized protein n=1 Tax=Portunus trituberculatus TaxID=210409 RepID=A0A5B7HLK1_PORTR|nr:hypothetical protein [Portunus trituberculatus]